MRQRVVQAFAARVKQRDLRQDLQVVYRTVGGMPSQRVDYTITVDPIGGAKVVAYDARISRTAKQGSVPPDTLDVASLFEQISAGLHSLLPASEATFLPDALVGSMTISVGGNEETFYFVPEEAQRRRQVAPSMDQALQRLWDIAKHVSEAQNGAKYE
jgi:hypothetical protein